MPNIIIDNEHCNKCNTCASICLMHIIQGATEAEFPRIEPAHEDHCMRCGHCEAFCPQQALLLDYQREEKIEYAESDSRIEPGKLALYMQKRRSIRHFSSRPVPKEIIQQILEVARYAPSGGNSQTVQWLVILDNAEVKRISGLTVDWMRSIQGSSHPLAAYVPGIIKAWDQGQIPICRNAPHLVFAHIPHSDFIDDRTDAIIALSHFDLAAPAFGIGTCWAGFIRMAIDSYPPLLDALALPEKRRIGYALFFGYPRYQTMAIPRRKELEIEWR